MMIGIQHIRVGFIAIGMACIISGMGCNDAPFRPPVHQVHIDYPAAYIVNGGSSNLSVIRLSDLAFTEAIDLDQAPFPHHIYLHPSGLMMAIAVTGTDLSGGHGGHGHGGNVVPGQRIQIIDAISGLILHEIPVDGIPHNAIFNPAGDELWVAIGDTLESEVRVYATDGWHHLHTLPVGKSSAEITYAHDGSKVFVANTGDGTVTIIDPASKMILATVPTGQDPVGAWPASNGHMYIDHEGDRNIVEMDVATHEITAIIDLGFVPGYAAYHDGTGELWIADATNGRVTYFRKDSGNWTQAGNIPTGENTHGIAFSPNGSRAFVTNQDANTVSVIDVTLHEVIRTIPVGIKPNGIIIRE